MPGGKIEPVSTPTDPPDGDPGVEPTDEDPGGEILDGLISAEMGEQMARLFQRHRRAEEARYRATHPDEGLRERKRRLTRRLISDAATALFAGRGFDAVRVSEIAAHVGVSEKTIYNYFPNKESMVLDGADDLVDSVLTALRDRPPGVSITDAVVGALTEGLAEHEHIGDEMSEFIPRFVEMIENTPALRAHWLEIHDRLAKVATEELAAQAGVDPREPEPMVAGRALIGLVEVGMESQMRHVSAGLRGRAVIDAVVDDVTRAARLLDTGLWSFNLPRTERARTQAGEAMRAAEEARRQVISALREARAAWDEARGAAREMGAEARRAHQDEARRTRRDGRPRRDG